MPRSPETSRAALIVSAAEASPTSAALTWNDETEMFEFYFKDETSERALFMDKDT